MVMPPKNVEATSEVRRTLLKARLNKSGWGKLPDCGRLGSPQDHANLAGQLRLDARMEEDPDLRPALICLAQINDFCAKSSQSEVMMEEELERNIKILGARIARKLGDEPEPGSEEWVALNWAADVSLDENRQRLREIGYDRNLNDDDLRGVGRQIYLRALLAEDALSDYGIERGTLYLQVRRNLLWPEYIKCFCENANVNQCELWWDPKQRAYCNSDKSCPIAALDRQEEGTITVLDRNTLETKRLSRKAAWN
jgi:hypothetical protein